MQTHYYLGANTPEGLYSLYHKYIHDDDRLFIIKGSPGSGKSTFMKKLAAEMEPYGLETELIHCSGDPDSLDGVYFPELGIAYADGTAPHVLEPVFAGVRETYLNFAECLDTEGLWRDREQIYEFNSKYKGEYQKAYSALAAAKAAMKEVYDGIADLNAKEQTVKKAASLARRVLKKFDSAPSVKERFTDALTCKGWIRRYDTIQTLAEEIYLVDSAFGLNWLFAETVAKKAVENNWNVIICRDPLYPERIAHVIVPQACLAVVSGCGTELPQWNAGTIRLDSVLSKGTIRDAKDIVVKRRKMYDELISEGQEHLAGAKEYHDRLEAVYRPHADFAPADRLFEEHSAMLKSKAGDK